MPGFLRKLGWLTKRSRKEEELQEELAFHLEEEVEKGLAAGLTEAQARAAARRELGNLGLVADDTRSAWSWPLLTLAESIWTDVRYGARMLTRNAKVTILTVLALAVGIGVNASVFTAYKAFWKMPLDARNAHEMVNIALMRGSHPSSTFSYPDYEDYRDSLSSFSGLVATGTVSARLDAGGPPILGASMEGSVFGKLGLFSPRIAGGERALVVVVSENYFEVLGVAPIRGRSFQSLNRSALLAEPAVLISENYWQRRFEGDPAIIGKSVRLNDIAVTIIGITPHDFRGTEIGTPAFWAPISIDSLLNHDDQGLNPRDELRYRLFGRLAPGVSMAQAEAEMNPIANQLRALHNPESYSAKPASALILPGSPMPPRGGDEVVEVIIALIMFAAAMVLAVACANVGSLQLARARSRQHELSTRLALGAGRVRVIRQLLTESVLVGVLAGTTALLLTWAFLRELQAQYFGAFPLEMGSLAFDATPDFEIVAYVLAVSLVAGILAGLTPAMESTRSTLSAVVRSSASSRRSRRLQDVLVAAQVSLSLALLIVAGMMLRNSFNLLTMPTGYDTRNVLSLDFKFLEPPDYDADAKLALTQELRTKLAVLPGVTAITSAWAPGEHKRSTAAIAIEEFAGSERPAQEILGYTYVQPNYFETVGVPLLQGRIFEGREQAVILSESAARRLWPDENAVGRSLRLGRTDEQLYFGPEPDADGSALQVVGVVRDKRNLDLGSDYQEIYLPLAEQQYSNRSILIRTQGDPEQVRGRLGPLLASIDPTISATAETLEERLWHNSLFTTLLLFGSFASAVGVCALLLALMGIYGTVGYIVVLRTREIGIRRSLGAQSRDLLALILRESTRPVLIGLAVGAPLAGGAVFLATRLLVGLSFVDWVSAAAVTVLFLSVALIASYFPARRVMDIDPLTALRHDG